MTKYEHVYDRQFFDYINEGSRRSAGIVIEELSKFISPRSVVDIGCGQGGWTVALAAWPGVEVAMGVDGHYIDRDRLLIAPEQFVAADLAKPFTLHRRFDLAVSLEVGEHLPPHSSADFVASIARAADMVLFSAAVPGQGGEHHVNERPLDEWRDAFAENGYAAFDPLRPALVGRTEVEPWYRYNTLLYARDAGPGSILSELDGTRLDPSLPVPDYRSAAWRVRCAILRLLPRPAVEATAALKHHAIRNLR